MATLNESQSGKAVKGRTKKAAPRVDLTAMVDLMFLLTTFFMLTTSLSTANAADIAKPIKCDECGDTDFAASRTMTILLGKNNQAVCYMGEINKNSMKIFPVDKIQSAISENKLIVAKTHLYNPKKYMLVIIKPTKTSKFKNFVDVIDEMKIADIKAYSIDDENISTQEIEFMKTKGI